MKIIKILGGAVIGKVRSPGQEISFNKKNFLGNETYGEEGDDIGVYPEVTGDIFAVGDIHGDYDALIRCLKIADLIREREGGEENDEIGTSFESNKWQKWKWGFRLFVMCWVLLVIPIVAQTSTSTKKNGVGYGQVNVTS